MSAALSPRGGDRPAGPGRGALRLGFAAIYLIWGSTYLGIRVAVGSIPPFLMAGTRFLVAGLLLALILAGRGAFRPTVAQWRSNAIIGAFLILGGNGVVCWAEQSVPSGVTALLIGIQPLFFVLTEWAWPGGQRPRPVTCLALAVGFVGVAWLVAPWSRELGPVDRTGMGAILFSCLLWVIGSIYSRHTRHGAEPLVAAALQMLVGALLLLVVATLRGEWSHFAVERVTRASWTALAYLIVVGSLVGYSNFVWLMKHSTPARVSTYAYVNPVVAIFLGWLILDEPLSARTLVASAIIICAVVIVVTQKNRPASTS